MADDLGPLVLERFPCLDVPVLLECTRMLAHLSDLQSPRHHGAPCFSFLQLALEACFPVAIPFRGLPCCAKVRVGFAHIADGLESGLCSLRVVADIPLAFLHRVFELNAVHLRGFHVELLLHPVVHPSCQTRTRVGEVASCLSRVVALRQGRKWLQMHTYSLYENASLHPVS